MSRVLLLTAAVSLAASPAAAGPIVYGPGSGSAEYATVLSATGGGGGSAQFSGYPPGPPAAVSVGGFADTIPGVPNITATAAASVTPVALAAAVMQFDLSATGSYSIGTGVPNPSAAATSEARFSQTFTLTEAATVTIEYAIGTSVTTGQGASATSQQGYELATDPGMLTLARYDTVLNGFDGMASSPGPAFFPSLDNPLVLALPAGTYVLSGTANGATNGAASNGAYTSSLSVRLSVAEVPEPGTLAVAAGLAAGVAVRRRRAGRGERPASAGRCSLPGRVRSRVGDGFRPSDLPGSPVVGDAPAR